MNNYVNFLIQLTEKDKRLLIALFIILIIVFVLIAYIGQGIKSLMKKYSKGIDGYMHELCSAKLIDNPKDFRMQVYKKESKVLYYSTRWIFRIFLITMSAFIAYTLIVKPGGESTPFAYVGDHIKNLFFDLDWPRGEFFGIDRFPIDWPYIAKKPTITFSIPAIVSYVMFIIWIISSVCLFTATLRFIARVNRGRAKSTEVFSRSLDEANFVEDNAEL